MIRLASFCQENKKLRPGMIEGYKIIYGIANTCQWSLSFLSYDLEDIRAVDVIADYVVWKIPAGGLSDLKIIITSPVLN